MMPNVPARRLRVVHCLDSFEVGGTELNAVRTIESLDRAAFDIRVVGLSRRGVLLERIERAGVPVEEFAITSLLSPATALVGWRLTRWLRANQIDIVHAHDIYSNIFVVPWARVAGVPVVIASRRWWTETNRAAHVWLNRNAYRLAHRVLANSASVGRLVCDEGVDSSRVLVIPNFVDDAAFDSPPPLELAAMRARLGVTDSDRVVGIVANLHPIKDHATLLDAFARLAPADPSLRLAVVGDGLERGNLEARAASLGIAERVRFAGRQPHQPSCHWAFGVSVLSSRGEGFPNSIVEAMAAARPIVATDVGGVPDAVTHGTTGLLVPAGDPRALADAMLRVLSDPGLARRLAGAAQRAARDRFSRSRVLSQLESTYRDLAEP
jgi:glycosyltransferase involved in cell wall biosynthesis